MEKEKKMKPGMTLYIRLDYRKTKEDIDESIYDAHLKYLYDYAKDMTLVGGGYLNEPGGMVIFEAASLEDAHLITGQDPIIKSGHYGYDLKAWEVIVASKKN